MRVEAIVLLFSLGVFVDAKVVKHDFVLKDGAEPAAVTTLDDDWWRTAIFYQIYPRSFKDSNADGTGDLLGIIDKLDHLKDLGVTAAWLSPIYTSPGVDQGYDISDYENIDPLFGSLDDLKSLIDKAHELGIKIIMDFVPNHTSDGHEWFQKSVAKDETYTDFYVWADTPQETLPNNWVSVFGGSAWEWNDVRKQYYLHQFASAQPDLNYATPAVVTAIKDVLKFWLDFGVDGFRIDAVPFLFEDSELKNEPLSGADSDPTHYGYLKHIYTTNLDATYNLIYEFRAVLDEYNKDPAVNYSRIMMTEAYTDTAEQAVRYYGTDSVNGTHFTFNFNYITDLTGTLTVDHIISSTNKWLSHLDKKYVSNWVLGNHDQHRVATRFGVENVDALSMLTAFLPGVQVIYMGEEIGMENGEVSCAKGHDPQAINDCTTFNDTSRDFERTPYQWDDTANAGFSNTSETWLPVSDKYKTTNLKAQSGLGARTHYNVYKAMANFRQNFKNISYDAVSLIKLSDSVLQIIRKTDAAEFIYLFNAGINPQTVNIYSDDVDYEFLIASVDSLHSVGNNASNPVVLQAHESAVLKVVPQKSGTTSIISTWTVTLLSIVCLMQLY